jgi:hypothetical protein
MGTFEQHLHAIANELQVYRQAVACIGGALSLTINMAETELRLNHALMRLVILKFAISSGNLQAARQWFDAEFDIPLLPRPKPEPLPTEGAVGNTGNSKPKPDRPEGSIPGKTHA